MNAYTIDDIKRSIKRLEQWEHLANLAQDAWDEDPMNQEFETAADNYYELQWNEWIHAAHMIERVVNVTPAVAREMLKIGNREKLRNVLHIL